VLALVPLLCDALRRRRAWRCACLCDGRWSVMQSRKQEAVWLRVMQGPSSMSLMQALSHVGRHCWRCIYNNVGVCICSGQLFRYGCAVCALANKAEDSEVATLVATSIQGKVLPLAKDPSSSVAGCRVFGWLAKALLVRGAHALCCGVLCSSVVFASVGVLTTHPLRAPVVT
jgi:hypothetical protein